MWQLVPCSWFSAVSFHGSNLLRMGIAIVRVALENSMPSSSVSSSSFVGKKKSLNCELTGNWSLGVYCGEVNLSASVLKDRKLPTCWLLPVQSGYKFSNTWTKAKLWPVFFNWKTCQSYWLGGCSYALRLLQLGLVVLWKADVPKKDFGSSLRSLRRSILHNRKMCEEKYQRMPQNLNWECLSKALLTILSVVLLQKFWLRAAYGTVAFLVSNQLWILKKVFALFIIFSIDRLLPEYKKKLWLAHVQHILMICISMCVWGQERQRASHKHQLFLPLSTKMWHVLLMWILRKQQAACCFNNLGELNSR